jgi:hypothetical protein
MAAEVNPALFAPVLQGSLGMVGVCLPPQPPPSHPTPEDPPFALSARAQKQWDQLDTDRSGTLAGPELALLAEWVWGSFRPGQAISAQQAPPALTPRLLTRYPRLLG